MPEPIKAETHASPLRCSNCGSNKFVVPDRSTDDSLVTCTDCGAGIGRWGDVRVGILEEAKAVTQTGRKAERRRAGA
jgi:predicted nucleic acid-binding Zn ribbon protein